MNKIGVVISRYNENIEWLKEVNHPIYLYNKGDECNFSKSIRLDNVGREAHTYLYHIVNFYEQLDDYTVFLQGNPTDHGFPDQFPTIELFNNVVFTKDFCPFLRKSENYNYLVCDSYGGPGVYLDIKGFAEYHNLLLDFSANRFEFVQGAQFAVHKNLILKRPKIFYEKLLVTLQNDGVISPCAHIMERIWKYIFSYEN
jgi:hypothetical protein